MAGARSLWRANGMKDEQMNQPVIAIVNSFQAVDQIYVMTKGGPHNSTDVLLYYIYEYGFVYWEPGMASSASALLFAFLLILTFFYWFGGQRMVNYER